MTKEIFQKIERVKTLNTKIANMGLKITHDNNKPVFFKTIEDLENGIKEINTKSVYKIQIEIETRSLIQINVIVLHFQKKEINKPFKIVEIARNINAFDLNFDKASLDVYKFWMELYKKLQLRIESLSQKEKKQLEKLVDNNIFKIA